MAIHEVHFNEKGEPVACSATATGAVSDGTLANLSNVLFDMEQALKLPILEYSDF